MNHSYKYPRPALTADCVVFGDDQEPLKVLLIERANEPFKGSWALPGGFAEVGESLETTASRELEEETGLKGLCLEQLRAFSEPDRDPREHVVTVAFCTRINPAEHQLRASSDARRVAWFAVDSLPNLAFDHLKIIVAAREHLETRLS